MPPELKKSNRHRLQQKAEFLQKIRSFFSVRDVLEVNTPLLNTSTITDPNIHSLTAQYQVPGSISKTLYLQTSPEFAMKRLLAAGSGDIFQLCPAFRGDVIARWHLPEFTILEWYRVGWDHHRLMDEVNELLQYLCGYPSSERATYREIFLRHLTIDPLEILDTDLKNMVREKAHLHEVVALSRDECLDALMGCCIEPELGQERPIFIYDYPRSQAALAQLNPKDPRVASRVEAYFKGVELGNGFHELTNATEQRQRFLIDLEIRKIRRLPAIPLDETFLKALETLPSCAGIAMGVDRLFALSLQENELDPLNKRFFDF